MNKLAFFQWYYLTVVVREEIKFKKRFFVLHLLAFRPERIMNVGELKIKLFVVVVVFGVVGLIDMCTKFSLAYICVFQWIGISNSTER